MDTLPPYAQKSNPYTIYALIDPRNYAVRYIGITNDVYSRFSQHTRCEGDNPAKDAWIAELKQDQQLLIMKTLEQVDTVEQALTREKHWIHHHLFLGCTLLNKQIPTIKIPTQPRPLKVRPVADRKPSGRKFNYAKVREIILHRYQHGTWPEGISRDMQYNYEFYYFVKPKRTETDDPKKLARHKKSYERGRVWIREFEEAQTSLSVENGRTE